MLAKTRFAANCRPPMGWHGAIGQAPRSDFYITQADFGISSGPIAWSAACGISDRMPRKSKPRRKTQPARDATPTSTKLIAAAAKEFNQRGFGGTDTNRIARRAGFAPQTFYRWFRDKTEIFLAVYRAWEEAEHAMLAKLFARKVPATGSVSVAIEHHRATKIFRRSLRSLSLENGTVRRARA